MNNVIAYNTQALIKKNLKSHIPSPPRAISPARNPWKTSNLGLASIYIYTPCARAGASPRTTPPGAHHLPEKKVDEKERKEMRAYKYVRVCAGLARSYTYREERKGAWAWNPSCRNFSNGRGPLSDRAAVNRSAGVRSHMCVCARDLALSNSLYPESKSLRVHGRPPVARGAIVAADAAAAGAAVRAASPLRVYIPCISSRAALPAFPENYRSAITY